MIIIQDASLQFSEMKWCFINKGCTLLLLLNKTLILRITHLVSIPFAPPSPFILILPVKSMTSKELGLHVDKKLLGHTANILWHAFDVNKNIVMQN